MTNGRKDLLAVMVLFGKTLAIALVIPVVPHCAIPFLLKYSQENSTVEENSNLHKTCEYRFSKFMY